MRLERIFEQQEKLYHNFGGVVQENGFHHAQLPCSLDDPQTQAQVKLTLYAFLEELGEHIEAAMKGDKEEAEVELIDALHFMVETFILLDLTPENLLPEFQDQLKFDRPHLDLLDTFYAYANSTIPEGPDGWPSNLILYLMYLATKLGYELKNKPWKQSVRTTNLANLQQVAQGMMLAFLRVAIVGGISPQKLYDLYFIKHKENNERIASGY